MVGGCERAGCVVGGSGGELVNLPSYVGVEHRIILAANAQCHIRIPFILFSILSSLILWLYHRRRIDLEDKAKVVTPDWGTESLLR